MIEPRVSIDNLTLVGDKAGDIERILTSTPYVNEKTRDRKGLYRWRYPCIDGTLIQLHGVFRKTPSVRIELNPNTFHHSGLFSELQRILEYIKYPRITRLDIAIDYFDEDLSKILWLDNSKRKRSHFFSRKGELETTYIGVKRSNSFRIYDKRREQVEKWQRLKRHKRKRIPAEVETPPQLPKIWWRIEHQGRRSIPTDLTNYNPFAELEMLVPPVTYPPGMKLQEKALIHWLMNYHEDWNQLSPGSQRKYRDKINELSSSSIQSPADVYALNKHHLQAILDTILSCCSNSPIV